MPQSSSSGWQITADASDDLAYAILSQDPVWNCFALADLEPPLRQYSQFAVASRDGDPEHALCLILRHPVIGEVLSPFGPVEGLTALLRQTELPEHPLIQAQERHIPVLERFYQPETSWRRQLRMALAHASQPSLPAMPPLPLRPAKRLTLDDLPALCNLYRLHPESAFSADLFPQAVYVGIYEGDHLIAAGGTHALSSTSRIAVLGNILTAPHARGQGCATGITAALVTALLEQHFSPVVLNVFADNQSAIRIYQRLGFTTHHQLVTGRAARRP